MDERLRFVASILDGEAMSDVAALFRQLRFRLTLQIFSPHQIHDAAQKPSFLRRKVASSKQIVASPL